eukprot:jgi/Botrbrau1/13997/Bobra.150_1s0008.1
MAVASTLVRPASSSLSPIQSAPSALSSRNALTGACFASKLPRKVYTQRSMGLITKAEAKTVDFDGVLASLAEKFEKSNNKPVVVGYTVAAVAAFFTAEWLIHLPGLDILLGFPVQLIGVLVLPYLAVKYLVNGDDVVTDAGKAVETITAKLPGLKE